MFSCWWRVLSADQDEDDERRCKSETHSHFSLRMVMMQGMMSRVWESDLRTCVFLCYFVS